MVETINKLVRVQRELTQENGAEPTLKELGERMDMTEERVQEIIMISQEPASLETPIGEEADSSLVDFIADTKSLSPYEAVEKKLLKQQVHLQIQKYIVFAGFAQHRGLCLRFL